jgi:hypothetical protein
MIVGSSLVEMSGDSVFERLLNRELCSLKWAGSIRRK